MTEVLPNSDVNQEPCNLRLEPAREVDGLAIPAKQAQEEKAVSF